MYMEGLVEPFPITANISNNNNGWSQLSSPTTPLMNLSLLPNSVRGEGARISSSEPSVPEDSPPNSNSQQQASIPEFVSKLYRMLQDPSTERVVSWTLSGDSFVIKDPSEFAKNVLPRHFRHSNFASFVRQLNKYDFHKVKRKVDKGKVDPATGLDSESLDQAWEFRHAYFRLNQKELLYAIKRKIPSKALGGKSGRVDNTPSSTSASLLVDYNMATAGAMGGVGGTSQVGNLPSDTNEATAIYQQWQRERTETATLVDWLALQYQQLKAELERTRQELASRDELLSQLLARMERLEQSSLQQSSLQQHSGKESTKRDESPSNSSTGIVGKDDVNSFAQASTLLRGTAARYAQNKQSPQQWIRPPRILLVEDDAVCLGLSARLLKLFGCHLDVATDGYSAVAKLTDNKYDMVLMDVGLPGMDGVQAAARIRSFDHHTPIVTMTGHTTANDCITYLSTGMNDILAKPFRKETLWEMLEKHCRHLEMRLPAITAEEFFPSEMPAIAKEAEELNEINGLSLSGVKRPRGGGI